MITSHFINVGQGNMAMIVLPDNFVIACDCNVTEDNENAVFNYLDRTMPKSHIDVFINTHRDADHMRGIKKLHAKYPIYTLCDSGVSGNTTTNEYVQYMDFRRSVTCYEVSAGKYFQNYPYIKILNGKRTGLTEH